MKYAIHNTKGEVLFEAEIDCDENAPDDRKKRLAVLWALENGKSLERANLRGADLGGANLRGADLSGAILPDCKVKIENIHQKVYEAASQPDALDMDVWHTCDTTHCRAGWVVHLAGKAGYELEGQYGTPLAALMIYRASDPDYRETPDFYATKEAALADMKRLAQQEAA